MSTDIIRFQFDGSETKNVFQWRALQIYLAVSLPLVVITCMLSYSYYRWETRKDRNPAGSPSMRQESLKPKLKGRKWLELKCSKFFSLVSAIFNHRQQASQV